MRCVVSGKGRTVDDVDAQILDADISVMGDGSVMEVKLKCRVRLRLAALDQKPVVFAMKETGQQLGCEHVFEPGSYAVIATFEKGAASQPTSRAS